MSANQTLNRPNYSQTIQNTVDHLGASMITLIEHEPAAAQPSSNIAAQVGACVGMAALLVYFIGLSPFSDLSDPRMLDETLGKEAPVYFLVLGLAATGAS
jgi:hypothetical protein